MNLGGTREHEKFKFENTPLGCKLKRNSQWACLYILLCHYLYLLTFSVMFAILFSLNLDPIYRYISLSYPVNLKQLSLILSPFPYPLHGPYPLTVPYPLPCLLRSPLSHILPSLIHFTVPIISPMTVPYPLPFHFSSPLSHVLSSVPLLLLCPLSSPLSLILSSVSYPLLCPLSSPLSLIISPFPFPFPQLCPLSSPLSLFLSLCLLSLVPLSLLVAGRG